MARCNHQFTWAPCGKKLGMSWSWHAHIGDPTACLPRGHHNITANPSAVQPQHMYTVQIAEL